MPLEGDVLSAVVPSEPPPTFRFLEEAPSLGGQKSDVQDTAPSLGGQESDAGDTGVAKDSDAREASSHAHKAPSLISAVAAAVINWLLMFGLCCAYGMIMFSDDWNNQHRALGVKMNLSTAMIMGLLLGFASKVPVAIGGPDLNPVVFLGGFVSTIAASIAEQLALKYPDSDAADDFCLEGGDHMRNNMETCTIYHEELRATVIFTVALSSAAIGAVFFTLGRFQLTRYASYVPTCVMEAFLSCVGYKVFKYALHFCVYQPAQFIPAACVGVPLYFLKAHHIGNPALVIPVMLLLPLGVFYGYVLVVKQSTIDEARQDQFMFPHMDNVDFFRVWLDCIGKSHRINFKAVTKIIPDLAVMIIVVLLDCLLKISSTEAKLPVTVDKDYEICLNGLGNVATVASGSTIGYMQLKFNVINYGVMGNIYDRRGGIIYGFLCGTCFFGTIHIFNYFPRFWLGTLLFFAGAGFVAENLWGSRKYLSFHEWMQIFVIVGVFIFTDGLLYAVLVGGLLTGMDFIARYAKISCISGKPLYGGQLRTVERKGDLQYKVYQHIANSWLLVIQLKGFVFFASAQLVTDFVRTEINIRARLPVYNHCRFVVFDCKLLDGMDASASKALQKLVRDASDMDVQIIWSHVSQVMVMELKSRLIVRRAVDCFADLDRALLHVEKLVLEYNQKIQNMWVKSHPAFELYRNLAVERSQMEPFKHILTMDSMRHGCPWRYTKTRRVEKYKTVLYGRGDTAQDLFLVHTGAIGIYEEMPELASLSDDNWGEPIAVYRHGWFLNREHHGNMPTRHFAVALANGEVLQWTEWNWFRMCSDRPFMASAISRVVMKQQVHDKEGPDCSDGDADTFADDSDVLRCMEDVSVMRRRVLNCDGVQSQPQTPGRASTCSSEVSTVSWGLRRISTSAAFSLQRCSSGSIIPMDTCSTLRTAITDIRGVSNIDPSFPEELRGRLAGVQIARVLEQMKLYEPVPYDAEAVLPSLPASSLEDLTVAFNTYCSRQGAGDQLVVLWQDVNEALMYAGVFNTMLRDTRSPPLTFEEFVALGHKAIMAPLSAKQIAHISELFSSHDVEDVGYVDSKSLVALFREKFHPDISIEEVDGIAAVWDDGTEVTCDKFVAIMSRFIRLHEQDWCLLRGFRELTQQGPAILLEDVVTVGDLVERSRAALTAEEAEEMIWAADWGSGARRGRPAIRKDPRSAIFGDLPHAQGNTSVAFSYLIANVLVDLKGPAGKLPPPPVFESGSGFKRRNGTRNGASAFSGDSVREGKGPQLTPATDLRPTKLLKQFQVSKANDLVLDLRDAQDFGSLRALCPQKFGVFDRDRARKEAAAPTRTSPWDESETVGASSAATARALSNASILNINRNSLRVRLHVLIEDPSSSQAAKVVSIVMGLFIIGSVLSLVLQPFFVPNIANMSTEEETRWDAVEAIFTALFTVEYVTRLLVADALKTSTVRRFLLTPSNVCDLLALVPFYLEILVRLITRSASSSRGSEALKLLRIVRLMRLSRVLKIAKLTSMGHGSVFGPIAMVLTLIWGIYMKTVYGFL